MRFPLEARVAFKWIDKTGLQHEAEGHTSNISEIGAYVRSRQLPSQGTHVQLSVFLPHVENGQLIPTPMLMQGTVVRIEASEDRDEPHGFAVELKLANSG